MANYSLNAPYLLLIGLVVVAVALVFLQFQPMIGDINGLRVSIDSLRQTVVEKQAFVGTLDRKRVELATYQDDERRLEAMLPSASQIEDVVRIMDTAAQTASGRLVRFVNQGTGVQQEINNQRARGELVSLPQTVVPLAATIEFTGSYSQTRAFLEQLSASARLIDLTRLTLTSSGQVSDLLTLEAQARFYYFTAPLP